MTTRSTTGASWSGWCATAPRAPRAPTPPSARWASRREARMTTSVLGATEPATSADVRRALLSDEEIALLDVRPEARFAHGHPLFAASLPLDRLELDVLDAIPRPETPIVVYG